MAEDSFIQFPVAGFKIGTEGKAKNNAWGEGFSVFAFLCLLGFALWFQAWRKVTMNSNIGGEVLGRWKHIRSQESCKLKDKNLDSVSDLSKHNSFWVEWNNPPCRVIPNELRSWQTHQNAPSTCHTVYLHMQNIILLSASSLSNMFTILYKHLKNNWDIGCLKY